MSEDSEKEHRFWIHFDTDFGPLQAPEVLTILQKDRLGTEKYHQKMELEKQSQLESFGTGGERRRTREHTF